MRRGAPLLFILAQPSEFVMRNVRGTRSHGGRRNRVNSLLAYTRMRTRQNPEILFAESFFCQMRARPVGAIKNFIGWPTRRRSSGTKLIII